MSELQSITIEDSVIINEYIQHLRNQNFPCVAAREAAARQNIKCFVADSLNCPKDDEKILGFFYSFVNEYRQANDLYNSAAVIFRSPDIYSEEAFDDLLWKRLQTLSNLDAENYPYDKRVNQDPTLPEFSFSIKEEAFYIIGLHANSSRASRKFRYPVLVFNPHAQFEELRKITTFKKLQTIIRKRDTLYSGSINPMLQDFGKASEAYQYSGRKYDKEWTCPLKINHAKAEHNPST